MSKQRSGFTLLELLVVISIMSVLVGLFISLIKPLRMRMKIADTKTRMQSIQNGMAQLGQNEGSACYVIQKNFEHRTSGTPADPEPGLGGIMTFGKPDKDMLPTIGKKAPPKSSEDNGGWGRRGRSHLAFPWGKKFPTIAAGGGKGDTMIGPEKFRLRDMSPFNTRKILLLAGILPTRTSEPDYANQQYMTNRKESEPWNDRWGHPLVAAAVLYQPTYLNDSNLPDGLAEGAWGANGSTTPVSSGSYMPSSELDARKALLEHLKLYQYNRSVYIAVASIGPKPRVDEDDLKTTTLSKWASSATNPTSGLLNDLWDQANWVTQQAKDEQYDKDWTELSFDNPPWQGIKDDYKNKSKHQKDANRSLDVNYKDGEEHCLITAPLEYH